MVYRYSFLLLVALIFIGCSNSNSSKIEEPSEINTLTPEQLAEGKILYTKCAVCHGHNAEGVKAFNSPALGNLVSEAATTEFPKWDQRLSS